MLNTENYYQEKRTIDLYKANKFALILFIPLTLIYGFPFYLIWKEQFTWTYIMQHYGGYDVLTEIIPFVVLLFLILILGIILHELIHGIVFALLNKTGFKSIKFGILKEMLTPYCHCSEPIKRNQYLLAVVMPSIILGFIPAIIAFLIGSILLLSFAYIFTIAAIGDFMIIQLLTKEQKDCYVLDHPTEAGFFVYHKK